MTGKRKTSRFRWMISSWKPLTTCKFTYQPVPTADTQIISDTSTKAPRYFVPITHRRVVFDTLHHLAHPGLKATVKLISARFFWPKMRRGITAWTRSCVSCQKSKVPKHIRALLGTFSTPTLGSAMSILILLDHVWSVRDLPTSWSV